MMKPHPTPLYNPCTAPPPIAAYHRGYPVNPRRNPAGWVLPVLLGALTLTTGVVVVQQVRKRREMQKLATGGLCGAYWEKGYAFRAEGDDWAMYNGYGDLMRRGEFVFDLTEHHAGEELVREFGIQSPWQSKIASGDFTEEEAIEHSRWLQRAIDDAPYWQDTISPDAKRPALRVWGSGYLPADVCQMGATNGFYVSDCLIAEGGYFEPLSLGLPLDAEEAPTLQETLVKSPTNSIYGYIDYLLSHPEAFAPNLLTGTNDAEDIAVQIGLSHGPVPTVQDCEDPDAVWKDWLGSFSSRIRQYVQEAGGIPFTPGT